MQHKKNTLGVVNSFGRGGLVMNSFGRSGLFCALLAIAIASGCGDRAKQPSANTIAAGTKSDVAPLPASTPPTSDRVIVVRDELTFREWGLRETAFDALARIGQPAISALVTALHAPDRDQREQAARALARMGPEAKEAVPDLVAALADPDEKVRKAVVRALGQIGPDAQSAVPAIVDQIKKTPPAERRVTTQAIVAPQSVPESRQRSMRDLIP